MHTRDDFQTRLSDFDDSGELHVPEQAFRKRTTRGEVWKRVIEEPRDEWGVVCLDDNALLVRTMGGRIFVHGVEAFCKWCGGSLVIREGKVFCAGKCHNYQGEFSRDLNDYLRWDGAKSFTLRRAIAQAEHLQLEERDLEPIHYTPNFSMLDEFYDEVEEESADQGHQESE
ncbi:MAG: hypothetical protein HXY34_12935 [Candidatus Thorarchaeota archaeon]|nr:hypothetical protein [Candidatus Thorarchaeota archaeon]